MEKFFYTIIEKSESETKEVLCITEYQGTESCVEIPAFLDNKPVYSIGRKAFWGSRMLSRVILPDTIERLEDWAFAGCHLLQEVVLPKKDITIGRKVFQKCEQLKTIQLKNSDRSLARLMACAAKVLKADYLLNPLQAGSEEWYQKLDAGILQLLWEPEETALKELVYCAEEDMLAKQEECLYQQGYQKAEAAFLRLLYSDKIEESVFEELKSYILQRTKGCRTEEAWEVIKASGEEQLLYCDKLLELGGFHEGNIDSALQDLGYEQIELKAYLLEKWKQKTEAGSIWDMLNLDNE